MVYQFERATKVLLGVRGSEVHTETSAGVWGAGRAGTILHSLEPHMGGSGGSAEGWEFSSPIQEE